MPIQVKNEVEWTETEQFITLKVPLKGALPKNVDIFSTNNYIKVSFPPYIYEVALYEEIDDDCSKATVTPAQVIFHLTKKTQMNWKQLESDNANDKAFMNTLRENAYIFKQQTEKQAISRRNEEKDKQKKFSVREQMKLDTKQKEQEKNAEALEKRNITSSIVDWKKNCNEEFSDPGKPTGPKCVTATNQENIDIPVAKKSLPLPRATGNITVDFTERILPTPARESKLPEEKVWLQKMADMNKMKQESKDTLDIEETSPKWLKDKGDDFFKKQNFVAAINAYTSALMLDATIPTIYSNRAACHMALKQYHECIQDCTSALEHYNPPVDANLISRCRAYTRRGTAYYLIEEHIYALQDYEAAIKLDPQNSALKADAFKIRKIVQGIESSD